MGCGCKNDELETISGETTNGNSKSLGQRVSDFLGRENKFSFIGLLLFLVILPIFVLFSIPIITILLFNKFVLGRNTNIINLIVFKSRKKPKK